MTFYIEYQSKQIQINQTQDLPVYSKTLTIPIKTMRNAELVRDILISEFGMSAYLDLSKLDDFHAVVYQVEQDNIAQLEDYF